MVLEGVEVQAVVDADDVRRGVVTLQVPQVVVADGDHGGGVGQHTVQQGRVGRWHVDVLGVRGEGVAVPSSAAASRVVRPGSVAKWACRWVTAFSRAHSATPTAWAATATSSASSSGSVAAKPGRCSARRRAAHSAPLDRPAVSSIQVTGASTPASSAWNRGSVGARRLATAIRSPCASGRRSPGRRTSRRTAGTSSRRSPWWGWCQLARRDSVRGRWGCGRGGRPGAGRPAGRRGGCGGARPRGARRPARRGRSSRPARPDRGR